LLTSGALAEDDPHLNVIVTFSADLPLGLVTEAEQTAKRVFDKAGVSTQWSNCQARGGGFVRGRGGEQTAQACANP